MEELIESVLSIRSETRREAFLKLVAVLQTSELAEDLFGLYEIAESADNPFDIIDSFEAHILKQVDELLCRLGVTVDYQEMNSAPYKIVWLLEMLDELEEFEEIDAILAIISSEEETVMVVNNLLQYTNPDINSDYYDILLNVEKRFLDAIENTLTSRKTATVNEEIYAVRGQRLIQFLFSQDNIPFFDVFEQYNKYNSVDDVLANIDLSELDVETITEELVGTIAIGVLLSVSDDYEQAHKQAQYVIEKLAVEEEFSLKSYRAFDGRLKPYFIRAEEESDE